MGTMRWVCRAGKLDVYKRQVWCVLALVRVFRAIPAAHIAILVLAVSFTVLACVNMKQRLSLIHI